VRVSWKASPRQQWPHSALEFPGDLVLKLSRDRDPVVTEITGVRVAPNAVDFTFTMPRPGKWNAEFVVRTPEGDWRFATVRADVTTNSSWDWKESVFYGDALPPQWAGGTGGGVTIAQVNEAIAAALAAGMTQEQIDQIAAQVGDLCDYEMAAAIEAAVDAIPAPDLTGLATETWTTEQITAALAAADLVTKDLAAEVTDLSNGFDAWASGVQETASQVTQLASLVGEKADAPGPWRNMDLRPDFVAVDGKTPRYRVLAGNNVQVAGEVARADGGDFTPGEYVEIARSLDSTARPHAPVSYIVPTYGGTESGLGVVIPGALGKVDVKALSACGKFELSGVYFAGSFARDQGDTSARTSDPLNSWTVEQLRDLPGVGVEVAEAIVAYRESNGGITVDDLINVPGIGKATLAKIKTALVGSE
jgi:competence ComEA-like helix-hairpin-helix protein